MIERGILKFFPESGRLLLAAWFAAAFARGCGAPANAPPAQ